MVVVTFLIFIVARGDLPKWKQIFTTKMGSGTATGSGSTTTSNSAVPTTQSNNPLIGNNPLLSNNPLIDAGSFDTSADNQNEGLVSF